MKKNNEKSNLSLLISRDMYLRPRDYKLPRHCRFKNITDL